MWYYGKADLTVDHDHPDVREEFLCVQIGLGTSRMR